MLFRSECLPTFQFLLDNGVTFIENPIITPDASTVPRVFVTHEWHIPSEVIAPRRNRNGSGLVRRLAESARKKGVQILLKHEMTRIVREQHNSGRVLGIVARMPGKLSEVRKALPQVVNTPELRFNCDDVRKFAVIEEVAGRLKAAGARLSDTDGVRVLTDDEIGRAHV